MTTEHAPDTIPDTAVELQSWRIRVLNVLFIIILVPVTVRIGESVIEAIESPEWWPQTLPFLAIYLILVALTVLHRLDFRLRAWGLIAIGYGHAIISLAMFGLAGHGTLVLLTVPLVGMLLLGTRSGVVATALSLFLYGLFTFFVHLGWLQNWLVIRENPTDLGSWGGGGIVFVGLVLMLVVMQWFSSQAQSRALERASRSTQELSAIRDQLQAHSEELDRYARLLEVSSLVSRETVAILEREDLLDRAVQMIAQQLHFDQAAIYTVDRPENEISLAAAAQPGHELTDLPIIQQVIRTGSQQSSQYPLDGQVHHELTLPLQVAGQIIGALNVHATRPFAFSEQEILALQGMADLLALAMENARLLTETRASLKELDALYRHYTAEAWQRFLGTRGETWHYQSGPEAVPNQAWEPLFAEAKQSGQAVTGESGQDGDRYYLLALPVKLRQIPIGVVGFYRPAGTGPWQPADIAAIEAVTSRLALSVENLRLLEEAQRRAARERTIAEITSRLRATPDIDTILRTAIQEIGRTLGASEGMIWLGDVGGETA